MDRQVITLHKMVKPEDGEQPIKVFVGSANNFRGVPDPRDYCNRPLMVDAWSQTNIRDFARMHNILLQDRQSHRQEELELKIKSLQERLRVYRDLLGQIHATAAQTSVLLGQQQWQMQAHVTNGTNGIADCHNKSTQSSPKVVNAINTSQQGSQLAATTVKYMIVTQESGNNNGEPIEFQLAEEDAALNLNSSADSGRLEICLESEVNAQGNTGQSTTPTTSRENQNYTKKRRQHVLHETNSSYDNKPIGASCSNMQQQKAVGKVRVNKSLLKTPEMQNGHVKGSANPNCEIAIDAKNGMVSIGPNNTRIPTEVYHNIKWTSPSKATRRLLVTLFDRKILATHSMTGKPSPAFKDQNKPVKDMLDPRVVNDIVYAVTHKCDVSETVVRNSITSKCADENKMLKLRMNKQQARTSEMNKENQD